MDEKRVYLIARLDEETNKAFADIYRKLQAEGLHGTQVPDFPYHITLGNVDTKFEQQILARAWEVCATTSAFTLPFNYVGLFGLRVLFAAPSVNRALLDLQHRIMPDQWNEDAFDWVAHTTLLMDDPANIQRAVPIVAKAFTPLVAKISRVCVYEFSPPRLLACFSLNA